MIQAVYKFKPLLGFFLVVILASCGKDPQLVPIDEITPARVAIEPASPETVTIEVIFEGSPSSAVSEIAPLKYDKTSVVNFEFDDNPSGAYQIFEHFKARSYSNGTGKPVSFTASCAVNSRGNYNNGDLWENYQGNLNKQQAIEMVKNGWTLANHGLYHSVLDAGTNFGFGKPIAENISENADYVFGKTGFKMRTLVVPSNDAGYLKPAFEQGIIATSSTNSFEGYTSYPTFGDYQDISLLPATNIHLRRDFNDRWDAEGQTTVKNKLTALFNKSSEKQRMLYRLGTHTPDIKAFDSIADHITNSSNGMCWVTSTQEFIEYLQTRKAVIRKDVFSQGKLSITLDISQVDKNTYFRDLTLKVISGTPIKEILVRNARSSSTNNATGLINISF